MKRPHIFLLALAMLVLPRLVFAQQNIVYNQYFFNPFLYNPSLITPNEHTELFVNYRKQWLGIQDGPSTATVNLQVPINYKMSLGATAIQDKAGVLRTTTGMLAIGYHIYFGNNAETGHKIGFGLSAGYSNSRLDMNKVTNPNDPALAANSTSSMRGQFGLHYQFQRFKAGFALPSIFRDNFVSEENFSKPGIDQISTTLSTLGYTFPINERVSFAPTLLYRTAQDIKQIEGMGVIKIDDLISFGGTYRQDYGAAAFVQLNVKNKLKVGYAYEFSTGNLNGFNNASHEFQIAINLGKKKSHPITKTETQIDEQPVASGESRPVQKPVEKEKTALEEPAQSPVIVNVDKPNNEQTLKKDMSPKKLNGENLDTGYYIVVGVFYSVLNANKYYTTLKKAGYPAEVGFYPPRGYYIVYMKKTSTIEEAKKSRDEYRARSRYSFKDTWIFFVE
jgi:type IX secretion system PorP/SprF family membrane protein